MVFTSRVVALHFLIWLSFGFQAILESHSVAAQIIPSSATECDTLVVCPAEFQTALEPWINFRQRQGHRIQVITPANDPAAIKQQILASSKNGSLKFVFLIGDINSPLSNSPGVPVNYVPAKVNVLFGSEPEIATDNTYADLDDDGLPDVAIGRLPADTRQEVADFLQRVMDYENNGSRDQHWRRNINFVAGLGGFGGLVDSMLENTAKQIITDLVPQHYQTSMTFGSWRSPYCPDPRQFSQTAIGRFNEGCLFWVYIGHGRPTGLDQVHLPDQSHSILDENNVQDVCCTAGNPIALFLSCYTGAIDHQEDCLAETMLRQPCGPVAAIAGTRVTMPYAMSLLSLELVNEYFDGDVETLGELMTVAKCRMVRTDEAETSNSVNGSDHYREMILATGKVLSPRPDLLAAERLEHVQMIHLFGDPLTRLKRPTKISLSTAAVAESNRGLTVTGIAPFAGELCVELVYRRDRFRKRPPHRSEYVSTDSEFLSYQSVYNRSHDLTCDGIHQPVSAGPFAITLQVPSDASGQCAVRCMLNSKAGFALGSVPVDVRPPVGIRSARKD